MSRIKDINALSNLYIILANEGFEKISIEGLPIKAFTRNAFSKIVSSWGELVEIRIKEIEAWSPKFITEEEDNSSSDKGGNNENDIELDQGNEYDHVSETSFAQGDDNEYQKDTNSSGKPIISEDPFVIYKLLKRNKEDSKVESADPQYPLGFTPDVVEDNDVENSLGKFSNPNTTDKVMCDHGSKFQASGSILEVMDELIKELNTKHGVKFVALHETKMDRMDRFSIKALWGNFSFDYAFSPSIGYSGGVLCIWDPSLFLKENATIFDSFLAVIAIREVLVEGDWIVEPSKVKNEFLKHFTNRLVEPAIQSLTFESLFPKRLSSVQNEDLERNVSYDEIKRAVWDCRTNISHGPDGFTFEFYRRYWKLIDQYVVFDVNLFFDSGSFPPGYSSSFIALIPKMQDAKVVKDFRPISLIGSVYKIITKIFANRLSLVTLDLVSDVQSAFVSNRQILDVPFILNELLSWCKNKNTKAMICKIDFKKSFDSFRWEFLGTVLNNFGFGFK
uniref:RNA-directed DNA polymerase, eukaryota, reverse transcriptase zinc-binding domain protein n=1 Tax=Tanacetum cinerariifolium TaxID=118510 RepID=A0A6L2M893_TANCI|nr:RNA-directed DNA polymerase, eukaryota, reverse transcriptase zinc-binding domain protein [Tanacetum cinerariifolium]